MTTRLLFLAVVLGLSSAAVRADTFTTTVTGNGLTAVFPNQGGPVYGLFYPRGNQLQVGVLVSVNGAALAAGELTFFLSSSANYYDLGLVIPLVPYQAPGELELYGPDLLANTGGINFISYPGTYNLEDASGIPYTYVVTDDTLSAVPEPPNLILCATATLLLCFSFRHSRRKSTSAFASASFVLPRRPTNPLGIIESPPF